MMYYQVRTEYNREVMYITSDPQVLGEHAHMFDLDQTETLEEYVAEGELLGGLYDVYVQWWTYVSHELEVLRNGNHMHLCRRCLEWWEHVMAPGDECGQDADDVEDLCEECEIRDDEQYNKEARDVADATRRSFYDCP